MNKNVLTALLCFMGLSFPTMAGNTLPVETDTTRVINLDEAIVVSSPKENIPLRRQPVMATIVGKEDIAALGAGSLKEAAVVVPSLYMPQYGSRLTSATYIRGIGSRSGMPAVGMYVDNMPYLEKSAFDFKFLDVERIDVMRGPQNTLYGRNTVGGLVRIATADPLKNRGTDMLLSASGRGGKRLAQFNTYLHGSETWATQLGAFYEGKQGFFRNATTGERADRSRATGAKLHSAWKPSSQLRFDLNATYEYSDEHSNPYMLLTDTISHAATGQIAQNRQSTYRRNLLTTGLGIDYAAQNFTFNSQTTWQYLEDRLTMDQDFMAIDLFTLAQRQRLNSLTQEFTIKSKETAKWQWTTGLFGNYSWMRTSCPVNFWTDGMAYLNQQFANVFRGVPHAMSLEITDPSMGFDASFKTPTANVAIFHQSTFRDILISGLSLTIGLRLDYDYQSLCLNSGVIAPINYAYSMPAYRVNANLSASPEMQGSESDHTWQLLPKIALQYDFENNLGNVYILASKGYRSGGYNIQTYSDLSQTMLRRDMMMGISNYLGQLFDNLPLPPAMREQHKQMVQGYITPYIPEAPATSSLHYDAETSWNFELGTHLNLFDNRVQIDAATYFIRTQNQQLSRFAATGMGRELVNAGKSHSCGGEISVRSAWFNNRLLLTTGYGFTHAIFKNYDLGQRNGQVVDYTDNRVPFVPRHTFVAMADFRQPLSNSFLKAITANVSAHGAGKIYWDEANTMSQPFNAQLSARIGAEIGNHLNIEFWGKNLTGNNFYTFQFANMQRTFAQQCEPRHFGVDIRLKF